MGEEGGVLFLLLLGDVGEVGVTGSFDAIFLPLGELDRFPMVVMLFDIVFQLILMV